MSLVLASTSPRRKELLSHFGYSFTCYSPLIDEFDQESPVETARDNARRKGEKAWTDRQDGIIVAADTVVALEQEILGKPSDTKAAVNMLSALSGRTHQVITGVALVTGDETTVFHELTEVTFRCLDAAEIAAYIKTGEPFDKAGSYGIQGFGGLFVEGIRGCYYNVVGLPMPHLAARLREYGIDPLA